LNLKRRTDLLILECTLESKEKMSEGWLLWELIRILRYRHRTSFINPRGKKHFLGELEKARGRYLHIASHGRYSRLKGTYLVTPRRGKVYSSELRDLWKGKNGGAVPDLVVLSACKAGHVDMVRAFSEAGCRYCVAPLHEVLWEDAAVFLVMFYKFLLGEDSTPWIAFKNTVVGLSTVLPRISGAWSFYEWGNKCMVVER
jgi:hypothetical protein